MTWEKLKDINAITFLQKLALLQTKLTELVAKQKALSIQMKVNMLKGGPRGK